MTEVASLRVRAMRLLARREYSRLELRNRLVQAGAPPQEIDELLDDFEAHGWLSEQRFVDAVIRSRRERFGARKVLEELRSKGVSDDGLYRASVALSEDETAVARKIWWKKFGDKPISMSDRAKQARFLAGRGFSGEVIRKVLEWPDD